MASSSPTAIASSPVKVTTRSPLWLAIHLLWWRHPMSSSSFRSRQAAKAHDEPRVADDDASDPNLSRCDHLLRRFFVLLTIDIRSSSVASDDMVAAVFALSTDRAVSNPPFDGEDTLLDLFVSDEFFGGRPKERASESIDHSEELIALLEMFLFCAYHLFDVIPM
ncbi:hypothetical protein M6B38_330585 [Iris pallida]|uniref:Uncharacterized protein n=1 Tax=Iris pallida TaxID=29817 RepID=A0AAX6H521_IRIPA|nr:hypothetical protein M6B38_330585 [Iris pallida]